MTEHKSILITAALLVAAGVIICGISFAALGFDIKALNSSNYVTNTYEIKDEFRNISIQGDTEDIVFMPSEDGKCTVVCYEDEKEPHDVRVEKDTLTIGENTEQKWHFGFFLISSPKITVYLPGQAYGTLFIDADTGDATVSQQFAFESIDVKLDTGDIDVSASSEGETTLKTDTGRISLHDMSAGDVSISTGTGSTQISGVTCANLYSTGNTGSLKMDNVIASGEFRLQRDTGSVRFEACDAESIYIDTDTGSVTGTVLTDKVFLAESDTGSVDVPKSITGGRCEITTDTGSIHVSVA